MRGTYKMINAVGRDIPEKVLQDTGMKVFQGAYARHNQTYKKAAPDGPRHCGSQGKQDG